MNNLTLNDLLYLMKQLFFVPPYPWNDELDHYHSREAQWHSQPPHHPRYILACADAVTVAWE